MKINIEKDTTFTMITERFLGESIIETIHIKHYSTDSNTFSFSLTHEIESQQPLHQLEHVIIDEHLVSNETCTVDLTNLLSNIYLQPSTKDYIICYISTEAISWKTQGEKGSKIEINVKENLGEELSSEVSRMNLRCSDETKMRTSPKRRLRSHVSTLKTSTEEIEGCLFKKMIFISEVEIKIHPNYESNSFSFSLNYEKKHKIHHGDLGGHKISVNVNRPSSSKNKVEYTFPDQFHISKETCDNQLLTVLSKIDICDRKYLVDYLSREAISWDLRRNEGEGIIFEFNVKDNVDASFEVESCNGDEEDGCSSRILTARMTEECAICLKGLLGEVRRMELSCFHKVCVMTWLDKRSSCPLCRKNVIGQVASLC